MNGEAQEEVITKKNGKLSGCDTSVPPINFSCGFAYGQHSVIPFSQVSSESYMFDLITRSVRKISDLRPLEFGEQPEVARSHIRRVRSLKKV